MVISMEIPCLGTCFWGSIPWEGMQSWQIEVSSRSPRKHIRILVVTKELGGRGGGHTQHIPSIFIKTPKNQLRLSSKEGWMTLSLAGLFWISKAPVLRSHDSYQVYKSGLPQLRSPQMVLSESMPKCPKHSCFGIIGTCPDIWFIKAYAYIYIYTLAFQLPIYLEPGGLVT